MKVVRTLVGMLVASALLCAGNLCINASKDAHGKVPYISVTVTFLIEVLKLVLVLLAIAVRGDPLPMQLSLRSSLYYAVPSFLYMVDNNLTYVILRFIDPATLSVLWNLKILTTAVLFRLVLKRQLSELRKIAIALLLLGVVTSQSDRVHKTQAIATTTAAATSKSDNWLAGLALVVVAVTISSCASVFTEWAFKRKGTCSFLWQNVQLYVYGILFNGVALAMNASELQTRGFIDGYNHWTLAVIVVNCAAGLSMGWILKFLDNMACVYAHAVAMMLTMLCSMVFFAFSPSLEFGCGLSVLLISMYLYHHKVDTTSSDSDSDHDSDSDERRTSCHRNDSVDAKQRVAKHRTTAAAAGNGLDTTMNGHVLAPGLLHLKKQVHYEQVPGESDLELASPASTTIASERSSRRLSA